ncbi:general odorant-binding protein 71 isoform X2 [Danaus plexippus]|uniref:general odorant-binding protein 71 isoform X2 n=1 Tax=Danaus plexippus TaxID=13037 RepID=UPI002AB1CFED|nr:general odorant-binding protein 71 isoform X2 [Danaus plexippus]
MRFLKHYVLFSCLLFITSDALSCRSKYGAKDERLKRVFNDCLKQQGSNSSSDRYNQERRERSNNNRYDHGRRNNQDQRNGDEDYKREDYNDGAYGRNSRGQMNEGTRVESGRNNGKGDTRFDGRNERSHNSHLRGQDEFLQSEEYGNQNYYSSSQSNGRYKREKKTEINSGQRSQYNPHSKNSNGNRDDSNENNSSENTNQDIACVLHCFLENLQMTGDNGMPDRYLITHALTKDERNEDLRDFLQESVEECFQILDNENTDDKCEFSKNLWMCLSEKGRSNCDDWPKKTTFMF